MDSSPAKRPHHAHYSAGVVPVRRVPGGWRLLLLRSFHNWDFPKGGIEAGETPLQAALRETLEEAALDDLRFNWGEQYLETGPYGSRRKVARYYIAETLQEQITLPDSPELGRPEHEEWRWVDLGTAERMLPPRLQPILAWVRQVLEGPVT